MKTLILTMIFCILLIGCAGRTVLLVNEEGELARCEYTATDAFFGTFVGGYIQIQNCIEEYERVGYKPIDEK